MIISKKSLWYRLADKYSNDSVWDHTDICTFTRLVLAGLRNVILGSLVAGFLLGCIASSLVWLYVGFMYGWVAPDPFTLIGGFTVIVTLTVSLTLLYLDWREERKFYKEPKPTFIGEAYKAFKEKYCVRVECK